MGIFVVLLTIWSAGVGFAVYYGMKFGKKAKEWVHENLKKRDPRADYKAKMLKKYVHDSVELAKAHHALQRELGRAWKETVKMHLKAMEES